MAGAVLRIAKVKRPRMSESILVGVDGSAQSRAALSWSMRRAHETGAHVLLLHVTDVQWAWAGAGTSARRELEAVKLLEDETEYARASWPSVSVDAELRHGGVVQELVKASEEVELSVTGSHPPRFLNGSIFGSRSVAFGATTRSSVAVIPQRTQAEASGIIVGIDNTPAGLTAIRYPAREAERSGEMLTLLRAFSAPRAGSAGAESTSEELLRAESLAHRMLAEAEEVVGRECPGLRVRTCATRGPIPEVLLRASERASLLVMGGVDQGRFGTGSMGQNIHDVLTNAVAPTIVARERRPQ